MLEGGKSLIYETCDGDKYDLSELPDEHLDFARRMYLYYLNDMQYVEFISYISNPNSFMMKLPNPTETPLDKVVTDLQARLGVKKGYFRKD